MQYVIHGSPGFSRWDACRDRASCRERCIECTLRLSAAAVSMPLPRQAFNRLMIVEH
jgi:hypothetical protein